jgi:3-dehydroquinate synthetase
MWRNKISSRLKWMQQNPNEKLGLIQTYQLNYNFRKIKSVSNNAATISADKKSMTISFPLNECIANPEITQLEVVLE